MIGIRPANYIVHLGMDGDDVEVLMSLVSTRWRHRLPLASKRTRRVELISLSVAIPMEYCINQFAESSDLFVCHALNQPPPREEAAIRELSSLR